MPNSNGIVQSNPMNFTHGKHNHNYSSFPNSLSYRHFMTARFGEYTPTFVMDGEPKDEISLNSKHLIDSLSLKAPFKGSIRKITESFMVPKMAILPLNWDRIYAQPANGDDVPKDANCVLQDFPARITSAWEHLYLIAYNTISNLDKESASLKWDVLVAINSLMRVLVYGEYFFSAGSLPVVCGYHSNNFIEIFADEKTLSYDKWLDLVISAVFQPFVRIRATETIAGESVLRHFEGLAPAPDEYPYYASFRSFLEHLRENPTLKITDYDLTISSAEYVDYLKSLTSDVTDEGYLLPSPDIDPVTWRGITFRLPLLNPDGSDDMTDMSQTNFNLSRILAYQLVCAHYYTNSAVDFIYSADLYREYIYSLINSSFSENTLSRTFSWNGYSLPYDYLSGHILNAAVITWLGSIVSTASGLLNSVSDSCLAVIAAVFGFRKSLRFGDYFVGSRPRPLAPVNTDVSVNSNMVSVIDVTRGIQAQRFANSVMRARAKIENYVGDLFGIRPAPDYHNPFFLTRQAEIIFGDEVQNTAEVQATDANSRTANFKSGNHQFTFTFHNDDAHPCVYLQIVSFDVKRAYTRSIDRHFFHLDRFDMFNPDFQYIGDQPVYGYELGYTLVDGATIPAVFGYQGRDMEYKQRFDVASGGFVENLPGWMLTDRDRSIMSIGKLDPDFIRSYNTELDQFFLSLSGYSLGSYWHFVLCVNNDVSAKRAMAVDPQILEG